MSNNLTEDDMSSDAHTTDVSRTSSYIATGSSFEESLAQSQAASGRFLSSGSSGLGVAAAASAAPIPDEGDGHLSSLAERLARAEETVGREHEKGLLYRQVCVRVCVCYIDTCTIVQRYKLFCMPPVSCFFSVVIGFDVGEGCFFCF